MERLACVNVAAFPLQLLLHTHPDWHDQPVAVVEEDRPHARVLWMNTRARRAGVRAGQRYAEALALERHLRAGTVSRVREDEGIRLLADRLRRLSPRVEASSDTPGIFWLDIDGFGHLHPSLHVWAEQVRMDIHDAGMQASVVAGFSRFGVYALAIVHRDIVVCTSAEEERRAVHAVPLGRLTLEADARDRLRALGVRTVGDFLRLPAHGIRTRFGPAIERLHQLATGRRTEPLVPMPAEHIHECTVEFDTPEPQVDRLLFVVKRLVDGLVAAVAHQALAITELSLHLTLDNRTTRIESIRPAAPTIDATQWLSLVRLRLDVTHLSSGIVTLRVVAGVCPATADQRRLFAEQTRRDTDAANHALARIRAEYGEQSVVRAHLCDAHVPAARFTWEPLTRLPERTRARAVAVRPLVRRIYTTPCPLDASALAAVRPCGGPYVVSGGWWATSDGHSVQRDYYFVHTTNGEMWWVYRDKRRRLFLQGSVE